MSDKVVVITSGPQGIQGPTGATGPAGPAATVANDVKKQGGTDINRIVGLNRVHFKDSAGAEPADGAVPPVGGTWVYNGTAVGGTAGYQGKKPVPPGCFDVEDFGAKPDYQYGTPGSGTDNLAAFNACIAAADIITPTNKAIKIIANGHFRLSGTLNIKRQVIIEGIGQSDENKKPGTMLAFPANTTGIHIYSPLEDATSTANYTVLRNISLFSEGAGSGTGNGVQCSATFMFDHVMVSSFGGKGFYIPADTAGPNIGNADASMMLHCRATTCGGDGYHFLGGDANIISVISCEATHNTGWGFRDASLSGNEYFGCHAEGNLGHPDFADATNHDFINTSNNSSTYVGCYSESATNRLYYPAMVLGGMLAQQSWTSDSTAYVQAGSVGKVREFSHVMSGGAAQVYVELGENAVSGTNMRALKWGVTAGDYYSWDYNNTSKRWNLTHDSVYRAMCLPTAAAPERVYAPIFENGIFLGSGAYTNLSLVGYASAPPGSGTNVKSDFLLNEAPAGNDDPLGWRCIANGAPGTWEALYVIVRGVGPQAMADANQVLAATVYRYQAVRTTGAITADRYIDLPTCTDATAREWTILNTCTGAFNIIVRNAAHTGGTVTIANGKTAKVWNDANGVTRITADA